MKTCALLLIGLLFARSAHAADASCKASSTRPLTYGYHVVNTFPHDPNAFTQGLIYQEGLLYESTGEFGRSSLRSVEIHTGRVQQKVDLPPNVFGEGLAAWSSKLVQVTWQNQTAFVYDRFSFRQLRTFRYEGEGWGLTADGTHLILSDGTAYLRFFEPNTFRQTRRLLVCDGSQAIDNLNELEYINGLIFANVWHTDRIAEISPQTGRVVAWIDLHDLAAATQPADPEGVLNGIAYDSVGKRLFITGKLWPKLYQIEIVRNQAKGAGK